MATGYVLLQHPRPCTTYLTFVRPSLCSASNKQCAHFTLTILYHGSLCGSGARSTAQSVGQELDIITALQRHRGELPLSTVGPPTVTSPTTSSGPISLSTCPTRLPHLESSSRRDGVARPRAGSTTLASLCVEVCQRLCDCMSLWMTSCPSPIGKREPLRGPSPWTAIPTHPLRLSPRR